MKTEYGQLTYCSNIHPGEDWQNHFAVLKQSIPEIKAAVCNNQSFGIGLRLANQASIDLGTEQNFNEFQAWLKENDCYVFTMNGFPYGGFHDVEVKDNVHSPDWTTNERTEYTIRMFKLLAKLLPENMQEGGISTSPLSYRFWWKTDAATEKATTLATENIIKVVIELDKIFQETGKSLHLDIEPEPDGLLENSTEFLEWYQKYLLPIGSKILTQNGLTENEAQKLIRKHIQLCFDICHFGVCFEEPSKVIKKLEAAEINVGKIQISSALKINLTSNAADKIKTLAKYNEPVYLHQVVAKRFDQTIDKFPDLTQAFEAFKPNIYEEWRVHFHVPLFTEDYGVLSSTQSEILKTLDIQKLKPFSNHLEIETYSWGVLPSEFQLQLNDSIIREVNWVKGKL